MSDAIHSDDAWKQEAQREKEKLGGGAAASVPAGEAKAAEAKPAEKTRADLPPASFALVIEQYVTQALMSMGVMPHPATGKVEKDLELARHMIDTLGVLQEKTKGNLTPDEERGLAGALYELRMLFVKSK